MTEKEILEQLIDYPKRPNINEWVYNVESFLNDTQNNNEESKELIDGIKKQGDVFQRPENLISFLKILYKKKYKKVSIPPIKKDNQIFVAMMFSDETIEIYDQCYKKAIESFNYLPMRIDEKQFNGSIINEITSEITNSIALIADLTGNRGGVYYEAGIARGLQLCNHPIELILTCKREFFDNQHVHFDLSGDNIILYDNIDDLNAKLSKRLQSILNNED